MCCKNKNIKKEKKPLLPHWYFIGLEVTLPFYADGRTALHFDDVERYPNFDPELDSTIDGERLFHDGASGGG